MIEYLINSVICMSYKKEHHRFAESTDVQKIQKNKLASIINNNKTCEYLSCNNICNPKDFLNRLPITEYEDYLPYIEKISQGRKNVLTTEDVIIFEPTSGSRAASKLIPYTKALKGEFQAAIKPWLYDLYTNVKGLKSGKGYWSISPAIHETQYTTCGIPIGFEDDSEYLGKVFEKLSKLIMLKPCFDKDNFYENTAKSLSECKNLSLISVWNPSFLLLLMEHINTRAFDNLKLISCWCDGNAEEYANALREKLPHVLIQPKGLIATEGIISIPFVGETGARLAVTSHFFEFLSQEDNKIYLAHQLEPGKNYEVIITTSGGLYRYNMHDLITVLDSTPRIKFLGRLGKVSDLFGEKISEIFVSGLMQNINYEFCMLAPETNRYVLYIKSNTVPTDFEDMLMKNFHYKYARELNQLKPLKIFRLTGNPEKKYMEECVRRGMKLGDVKPTVLSLSGCWNKVFEGEYL